MPHAFNIPVPDVGGGPDPVGVIEIADRLGVKDRSVHTWKRRDRLPVPDYPSINGGHAWEWSTILWWAGETDRLYTQRLCIQHVKMFGKTSATRWSMRATVGIEGSKSRAATKAPQ